jgi:hypothetical protein
VADEVQLGQALFLRQQVRDGLQGFCISGQQANDGVRVLRLQFDLQRRQGRGQHNQRMSLGRCGGPGGLLVRDGFFGDVVCQRWGDWPRAQQRRRVCLCLSVQRQERVIAQQGPIGRRGGQRRTVEHEALFQRQHLRRVTHQAVAWCFDGRFGACRLRGRRRLFRHGAASTVHGHSRCAPQGAGAKATRPLMPTLRLVGGLISSATTLTDWLIGSTRVPVRITRALMFRRTSSA